MCLDPFQEAKTPSLTEVRITSRKTTVRGWLTPAAFDLLTHLWKQQQKFCEMVYVNPQTQSRGQSMGIPYAQAVVLKRIAETARYRGAGIPKLARVYFPAGSWRPMIGGVLLRAKPGRIGGSQVPVLADWNVKWGAVLGVDLRTDLLDAAEHDPLLVAN